MSDQVPKKWDATHIPSQQGKSVIITGANSGIGYVMALELARHGANVVLACRSEERGTQAVAKIQEELQLSPGAGRVEFGKLDVSSLASVKAFTDSYKATHQSLDLLINNAGVMAPPHSLTVDGYESQFATNHLGHFALTAQLIELLKASPSARIVIVGSIVHRHGKMDLNEIMTPKDKYKPFAVYQNSKLYDMLFMFELNRRLKANGVVNVIATSGHPGWSTTNLKGPMVESASWCMRPLLEIGFKLPFVSQSPEMGALPTLYAATAPGVKPDDYYGPEGFYGLTGYPALEEPQNVSRSEVHAAKLWEESERLAKLSFTF